MNSMLYIIYGIGNDAVGLVGQITAPIAQVGGNVVDMRQDVLHGLFTISMVVDLKRATLGVEDFAQLVQRIAGETGLRLTMEKYTPISRGSQRKNMLVTLVGRDRPGIIAAITEKLGKYNINIETSDVVARQNIFLMDLLTDVSQSALPMENLRAVVSEIMQAMHINTMFQTTDVFNKKKKIVLFDIAGSFIDAGVIEEILLQAGIEHQALERGMPEESDLSYAHATAALLEGLPLKVIDTVMESLEVSQGTRELLQTLRIMGYKIGLISKGFSFFTDALREKCGLDYAFGYELPVDEDSQTIEGDLPPGVLQDIDRWGILVAVMEREGVSQEDITSISDQGEDYPQTPGIGLAFDMKVLLDLMNQHILSRETLTGLLRSFGIPA